MYLLVNKCSIFSNFALCSYRTKYGNVTGDVYQQYIADYDRIRDTLEAKYLKKTREYSARIAFRKTLMRRYARTKALKKLNSHVERQRFYGTAIKWNWVVRKKFVDWTETGRKSAKLGDPEEQSRFTNTFIIMY